MKVNFNKKLESFLSEFLDDAKSWSEATGEIRAQEGRPLFGGGIDKVGSSWWKTNGIFGKFFLTGQFFRNWVLGILPKYI